MTDNAIINRVLAEKVMKWVPGKSPFTDDERKWYWSDEVSEEQPEDLWNPCENIEQAFMVVEKLREQSRYELDLENYESTAGWTWAAMFGDNTGFCSEEMYAETPAMAICLAAYQLVEEK